MNKPLPAKLPRRRSKGILRIFFATSPWKAAFVSVCLLLAGLAEGIGYATLLPVLSVAIGQSNDGSPSWLQRIITDLLTRLHVPLDNLGFLLLIVI
ncbi:MAG: hypothetical protein ACREEE_14900, partial [Dongiaceae bacterium]